MEFINFGIFRGKMYKYFRNEDTFIIPEGYNLGWGNSVVYGGIFLCKDFDFYSEVLDGYYLCSLYKLRRNHIKDLQHRIEVDVTPIFFNNLDELARLKYREGEEIQVTTYVGNVNHPKIKHRIIQQKNIFRIVDGVNKKHFKKLFWEISNEENRCTRS